MGLFERLVEPTVDDQRISVHAFAAALNEWQRGAPGINQAALTAAFNLSAGEVTELNTLKTAYQAGSFTFGILQDVLLLAEAGYMTKAQVKNRLGV